MDASGLVVNAQRKKFCEGKNIENGKDRFGNLPETLVSHILSFLPTNDAVRTSVLSTRWKYMWTSITNLHFDDSLRYSHKRRIKITNLHFMNFVDRVLVHYGNSTIHSFYLRCGSGYDASRVNAWISAVVRKNVKRLDICYLEKDLIFPRCLFSCDSLTELKLSMSCTLKVPTSLCFPSLKILKLSGVTFLNEHFSKSRQHLFSFPVLEVFDVMDCTWSNVKIVNIDAPVLNSLTMVYCKYKRVLDGSHDCVIKICVPNLTKFNWRGSLSEDIILLSPLSSVCDATVEYVLTRREADLNNMREIGRRACMLLKKISSVKYLRLSNCTIEALAHAENLQAILPTFDKLIHLRLEYSSVHLVFGRSLMDLLRSFPVLESLIFATGISHWVEDEFVEEMLPQCFQSHLKVVEFEIFYGKEHELELVKFLLENAMVLEEIIVTAVTKWELDPKIDMEEVKKQIITFPKASKCATLVFS